MCGIAGIVNFARSGAKNSESAPPVRRALEHILQHLAHRGPDGNGIYVDSGVGLAHCRLAILDPAGGAQPLSSSDGRVHLSYNGEVYNYREIRTELRSDAPFHSDCDTEVVLRAYQKWGIACLQRLRGMFAIALYDAGTRKLYLARDRAGVKPLYYSVTPERLLFCSELFPLMQSGLVEHEMDLDGLSGYFRYQYVPTPRTIYKGVRKLEPGHFLEVDIETGRVRNCAYWELRVSPTPRTEAEARDELDHLLERVITLHVRSDVPFGAFLSGGVDSSVVTALMSKELKSPVKTFSIGYREEAHSELRYASMASKAIHTEHYPEILDGSVAGGLLASLAKHFGEPFGDSSAVPTYWVSRLAARHVKMVLSGDGGDELFAGYNSYAHMASPFADVRGTLRHALRCLLSKTDSHSARVPTSRDRARLQRRHNRFRDIFTVGELADILREPGRTTDPPCPVDVPEDIDPVLLFQWQDFKTYMVDDVLTKVDRMSMANSLEVRVPLLDHELAEFAFSLPRSLRLRGWRPARTKYLLKEVARRYFPDNFVDRRKHGFGIPLGEWLRGSLRTVLGESLRDTKNPMYEWVNVRAAHSLLADFERGSPRGDSKLWLLLMFHFWTNDVHLSAQATARAA